MTLGPFTVQRALHPMMEGQFVRSVASPDSDDPDVHPGAKHQSTLNLVVVGDSNTITVQNSTATIVTRANPRPQTETWWTHWRKRGLVIGTATVISAAAAVATLLGWAPWS